MKIRTSHLAVSAAAIGALVLAGCGSSGGNSGGNSSGNAAGGGGAGSGSSAMTVSVTSVSGHSGVLTAADGRTLYFSDKENGSVLCKSSACTAIWKPLTVAAGQTPSGPTQVMAKLSTVKRPDGKLQVALGGKPLYEFSFDHGSGDVGGDGQKDSFDGTNFTWQIATATGAAAPAPAPSTSSSSGGGYTY